jgi:hypothetical protein
MPLLPCREANGYTQLDERGVAGYSRGDAVF